MSQPPVPHLFHMAPLHALASLQERGLDPASSREPAFRDRAVYLAADAGHARAYEDHHGDWPEGGILLRVAWSDLDPAHLAPDDVDLPDLEADWEDLSAAESLSSSGQCRCLVVIPPTAIEASPDGGGTWLPLLALELPQPTPEP